MFCLLKLIMVAFTAFMGTQVCSAKEKRTYEIKLESLRYLQDLRVQNVKRLRDIDDTLRTRIENTEPLNLESDINNLKLAKREHSLRQEFLDRLIFQVDTKFTGGDFRVFLERALTEMAKTDAVSATTEMGLWKFLKFASDAVRRLPEKNENILPFLEGYMNRSVSNPMLPQEFLNSRNYSNGSLSEPGRPMDREEVGAVADRRLQELQAKPVPEKAAH